MGGEIIEGELSEGRGGSDRGDRWARDRAERRESRDVGYAFWFALPYRFIGWLWRVMFRPWYRGGR